MNIDFTKLGRSISILERVMKIYYNRGLEEFKIGWGQQFFLEYICDHPGSTPQNLTDYYHVDRATVTKALKRLAGLDYIEIKQDERDRRVRKLYVKEKAYPACKRIRELHKEFYEDITLDIEEKNIKITEDQLNHMIVNLTQKVRYKMEKPYYKRKGS